MEMMENKSDGFAARAGEEGKSLVEIAMVVMIIAVVVAMALPAVANSIRAYNLRSAAARIAERLGGARALAMAKNNNVSVAFATNGGGIVTAYGYDFSPVPPALPDGTPDTIDPDDTMQSYYIETPPDGITVTFTAGGTTRTNGKTVTYTSRGELPIADPPADIRLSNSAGSLIVSVNLRGQVWVH